MEEDIKEIVLKQLADIRKFSLLAAKNILDVDDVVALTGLSKGFVYKLTCRKEIPHYKPNGKLLYFDRQEIESWMKQNRVNTIEEAEQTASKYLINNMEG
jgi:excisionase family DNA binding protein